MEINLNLIFIGLLSIPVLYLAYIYVTTPPPEIPVKPRALWGEQVGRTRPIQSKTGDASMATELSRRRAIIQSGRLQKSKLKESQTSTGSTTGAYETFFLTAICPVVCAVCPSLESVIFDAGGADSEYCPILDDEDDGIIYYDGGNIDTRVCNI